MIFFFMAIKILVIIRTIINGFLFLMAIRTQKCIYKLMGINFPII